MDKQQIILEPEHISFHHSALKRVEDYIRDRLNYSLLKLETCSVEDLIKYQVEITIYRTLLNLPEFGGGQ